MREVDQMKTDEDEAFEYIERHRNRLEIPLRADLNPYETLVRINTLEEVARAIERFRGAFGDDTVDSFSIFIRSLK